MRKTKICCLDVSQNIIDYLSNDFDVYNGSLGKKVDVSYSYDLTKQLLLNHDLPKNLHEYDIIIDEMCKFDHIPFSKEDHTRKNIIDNNASYFILEYPNNVFDPIPCGSNILKNLLQHKQDKVPIKILFQEKKYDINYTVRNIANNRTSSYNCSNYDHIQDFTKNSLIGQEVLLNDSQLSKILYEKFLNEISYYQTYDHPKKKDNEKGTYILNTNFIPLLKNKNGQIVSYAWITENDITFMLPQLESKVELLQILFNEIIYKHFSEYIPTITANSWLNNSDYYLPGHQPLLEKKEENRRRFENEEKEIDEAIKDNKSKNDFLHKILTETGDFLVEAITQYLRWLGFTNVIIKDETAENGLLEEDIQIDLKEKGLLIIEVKGINGTSTDAECSQIHKIKFRRCEQRGKFDVYALYIVNNERCIEPLKRTLPPFNEIQIQDAINDKRGLAYTWQFFNLYFNIENNIITKEEARERLLNNGLIDFTPALLELGKPYKYYQSDTVVCLTLNQDYEIKVDDELIYEKDGRYYKERILEIQQDGNCVQTASNGSFGIKIQNKIPRNKILYLKNKL